MKYLLPFVMAITILAGITLAITPYALDFFFPIKEDVIRDADPEDAEDALAIWFLSPDAYFSNVRAARQQSAKRGISWFTFKVKRTPVERFISAKKLKQTELTESILKYTFYADQPPREWWKPKSLTRETYFQGVDQGRELALIYNAETQYGVLVTKISAKEEPVKK